jgi:two-component system, NtrC family, sensor histidine kinase GlrK
MAWLALLAAIAVIAYLLTRLSRLQSENKLMASRMEVEQMKKNFISHVSHELKAPLASMQETTHLMLERIPGPLTDKQTRLLDLNLQSGKRLAHMLGNILDVSRLEAGIVEYDMRNSDIAGLMNKVLVDMSERASAKSLRFDTDVPHDPLMIKCDPNRMAQLFTNLIENAVQFSNRDGVIGIRITPLEQPPQKPQAALNRVSREHSAGFALVEISDSGPGIEDSQKEMVFHTFHQTKQGKKSHGESLGLGLAISRALVEAHDGAIWVEDNPTGGAIFFVVLPRAAARESLAEAS